MALLWIWVLGGRTPLARRVTILFGRLRSYPTRAISKCSSQLIRDLRLNTSMLIPWTDFSPSFTGVESSAKADFVESTTFLGGISNLIQGNWLFEEVQEGPQRLEGMFWQFSCTEGGLAPGSMITGWREYNHQSPGMWVLTKMSQICLVPRVSRTLGAVIKLPNSFIFFSSPSLLIVIPIGIGQTHNSLQSTWVIWL